MSNAQLPKGGHWNLSLFSECFEPYIETHIMLTVHHPRGLRFKTKAKEAIYVSSSTVSRLRQKPSGDRWNISLFSANLEPRFNTQVTMTVYHPYGRRFKPKNKLPIYFSASTSFDTRASKKLKARNKTAWAASEGRVRGRAGILGES